MKRICNGFPGKDQILSKKRSLSEMRGFMVFDW